MNTLMNSEIMLSYYEIHQLLYIKPNITININLITTTD